MDDISPRTSHPVPRARSFPWFAYALLALVGAAVIIAGLVLVVRSGGGSDAGTVSDVRISPKSGIDFSKLEEILDTPDYYVEVWTAQGKERTATFKDTRVGNGLTFKLPVPLRLVDVKEIRVFDENVLKDELVDRVDRAGREIDGEKFHFQLIGDIPQARDRQVGVGLLIAGGAILLLAILRFIWAQVI